jgi:DNA polymerase sigma
VLQNRQAPVLPVLQEMPPTFTRTVGEGSWLALASAGAPAAQNTLASAHTDAAARAPTHPPLAGKWCCDYCDDMSRVAGYGARNSEGVGQLLVSFFCYWARQHDYKRAVVSVRVGGGLAKADKGW